MLLMPLNAVGTGLTLLKRSDEKAVTELAYENAKFVEDLVRDSLIQLKKIVGVSSIRILAKL